MLHAWFTRQDFTDLVKESWDSGLSALDAMDHFRQTVQHWNCFHFGNVFERKQRCQARLKGVQDVQADRHSDRLYHLERELIVEIDSILAQEELIWQQKSRVNWLKAEERISVFFMRQSLFKEGEIESQC